MNKRRLFFAAFLSLLTVMFFVLLFTSCAPDPGSVSDIVPSQDSGVVITPLDASGAFYKLDDRNTGIVCYAVRDGGIQCIK